MHYVNEKVPRGMCTYDTIQYTIKSKRVQTPSDLAVGILNSGQLCWVVVVTDGLKMFGVGVERYRAGKVMVVEDHINVVLDVMKECLQQRHPHPPTHPPTHPGCIQSSTKGPGPRRPLGPLPHAWA
jgi:hypothetical protein